VDTCPFLIKKLAHVIQVGDVIEEVFCLFENRKGLGIFFAAIFVLGTLLSGCGDKQAGGARPTAVKAMNVLRTAKAQMNAPQEDASNL